MKRFSKILFVFMCVMFLPLMVNAKEKCTVVSGNKTDIGSEIACGSEHFYIVNSDDKEVKMLAKYNLNVGVSIYKEKIEKAEGDTRTDLQYCLDLANSKGAIYKYDDFYNANGYCFYAKKIETDRVLQSEEAVSAHWDKDGNYLYPQVGDVYFSFDELLYLNSLLTGYSQENEYSYFEIDKVIENSRFIDYNFKFDKFNDNSPIINYTSHGYPYGIMNTLGHYKNELTNMDINVNDISLLSISELDDIVNKISNKRLPFNYWTNNYDVVSEQYNHSYNTTTNNEISFGSLKEYIPEDYDWLYSTSYWNRTIFYGEDSFANLYFVFTSGLGKICGAGFPTCAPETAIGTGVRPVITINSEDIVEPPRTIINNPQTGGIAAFVLVWLCGLFFIGRKVLKRIS